MKYLLTLFLFSLVFGSCNTPKSNKAPEHSSMTDAQKEAALIELNKRNIEEENIQIDDMLNHYKWPVTRTETDVRYWIYAPGRGVKVMQDNVLHCIYTMNFINGDPVYDKTKDSSYIITIGKSAIPLGLAEALLYMHQGDRAKIIVPSYRAYSAAGDGDAIPPYSTLIYDLYILQVKHN